MKQRVVGLTVLVVAIAMAYSAPEVAQICCLAMGLVPVVVGARVEVDRVAQAAVTIVAMMTGVLAARWTAIPVEVPTLLSERTLLLGLPMLAVAAARACLVRPMYGDRLTLLAALVALTAAGRAQTGWVFPVLAAVATLLGLLALRISDPSRAPLRVLEARHFVGLAFGALTAAALAGLATWTLPRVHDAMMARMMARAERNRTGFSDAMWLGAMQGMLESNTVVMRVRGAAPPLLRGVIFTQYHQGRWETGAEAVVPEVVETSVERGSQPTEVEHAGRPTRYFLPLGADDVAVSSGIFERDPRGIARPSPNAHAKRVWFDTGELPRGPPPTLADLQVPRKISSELQSILESWGAAGRPPREALETIEARLLRDYTYSLESERSPSADPVLDFLKTHKQGHCEYFAAAFALLARSARVPARVVAGYRVSERSPLGYMIVRERNAHSWVEVFVDDHWETFDPTPASDLAAASPATTPWISAMLDGLRTGWEAVDDWFGRRSAFELSLALVTLLGALVMVRAWRARGVKGQVVVADQPKELTSLWRALKQAGVERAPSDTLGALARRVEAAEQLKAEIREEVAAALRGYERHRYGGEGTNSEALGAISRAASRVA